MPMFSFKNFIILALTFTSLIHFEFIFKYAMKEKVQLYSFACGYPIVPTPIEETNFPFRVVLVPLLTTSVRSTRVCFWNFFLFTRDVTAAP